MLIASHAADETGPVWQAFDHKVFLAYRWSPDRIVELLRQAGLGEVARLLREPDPTERFRQACLLVRKPARYA